MKKCLYRNEFQDKNFISLCGINLLKDSKPLIVDLQNSEIENVIGNPLDITEDVFNENTNLCIPVQSCKIIYDLKSSKKIDRIIISSVYNQSIDYGLSNYELFISDSTETLFNKENCIVEYDNSNNWESGELRNGCDQVFDIYDYKGRFFAIKINISNPTDSVIRLSYIGLYNHELTEQLTYVKNNFGDNLLKGRIPAVKGTYTADLSCLTNGTCFDKSTRVYIDCETEYTFKIDKEIYTDSFYIVGSDSAVKNLKIFVSNNKDDLISDHNAIATSIFPKPTSHSGTTAAICMTDEVISFSYVAFKFSAGDFIDEIGIIGLDQEMIK